MRKKLAGMEDAQTSDLVGQPPPHVEAENALPGSLEGDQRGSPGGAVQEDTGGAMAEPDVEPGAAVVEFAAAPMPPPRLPKGAFPVCLSPLLWSHSTWFVRAFHKE
jgi:hypothetical protein